MSVYSGPNIPTNGLVLYYDINNIQKSWRGAPTTNLISDPFAVSGNPSPIIFSGYETTNNRTSSLPDAKMREISDTWVVATKNTNTNGRVFFLNVSSLSTNTDYCFSMYAYTANTATTQIICGTDNGAVSPVKSSLDYNVNNRTNVQRINCVFTSTNGQQVIGVRVGATDPTSSTIYFTGIQVEARSFPTPVVNGTRSNTQAITDLTGQCTITATSLTYNSDNTFTFNGVDNYLDLGTTIQLSNNFTLIAWHKNPNTGYIIDQGNIGSDPTGCLEWTNYGLSLGSNNISTISASGTINPANWNNVACTFASSVTNFYINGNLDSTINAGFSSFSPQSQILKIGRRAFSTSSIFSGTIGLIQIYNRVLSANEIRRNFNAFRSRFGL